MLPSIAGADEQPHQQTPLEQQQERWQRRQEQMLGELASLMGTVMGAPWVVGQSRARLPALSRQEEEGGQQPQQQQQQQQQHTAQQRREGT